MTLLGCRAEEGFRAESAGLRSINALLDIVHTTLPPAVVTQTARSG